MNVKRWAENLLDRDDLLILDTETTGLHGRDEVVQIAIIDGRGDCLMDSLVKPAEAVISREAEAIHGISMAMVKDAPTLAALAPHLLPMLEGRRVAVYNAPFDRRLLQQSAWANKHEGLFSFFADSTWDDVMKPYARFYGEWNHYRKSYTWQSLTSACKQQGIAVNGAHNALADCLMTLELIRVMAGVKDG